MIERRTIEAVPPTDAATARLTANTAVIELSGVRKRYGNRLVLDDVDLRIAPGVTGLLGPNGSGKSTLIKSLMGLVKTEAGEGHVLDIPWPQDTRSIRDHVGYLPEDDCYIAGLQGVEAVQLSGRLSGLPRMESLRRAHEVMDFCDIGQERYRQVETYSTGMRQKLKFAQTLVHDPSLIILDEPTTGLDPGQREGLLNRIQVLARTHGKAVLLSTHILSDVRQVCDSVVILAFGRIRVADSLEALSRPARPGLSIAVASGMEALVNTLRGEGLTVVEVGLDRIQIEDVSEQDTGHIWQAASRVGAHLRGMEPARASLDEIFMEAVRERQAFAVPSSAEGAVDDANH